MGATTGALVVGDSGSAAAGRGAGKVRPLGLGCAAAGGGDRRTRRPRASGSLESRSPLYRPGSPEPRAGADGAIGPDPDRAEDTAARGMEVPSRADETSASGLR